MSNLFEAIELVDREGRSLTIERVRYLTTRIDSEGRTKEHEIRAELVAENGERFAQLSEFEYRSLDTGRRYRREGAFDRRPREPYYST